MGGIAGCYGSRDETTIKGMLAAFGHQGPQQQGLHCTANMVWGQSGPASPGGQQPLVSEDKARGVIASGDIYNRQRLRARLAGHYRFQGQSASEVILALYEQRGPDGVRALDGTFALALFDSKRDIFMLARDPLGVKPLYYGYRARTIYFASERPALVLAGVAEVYEFPPGHYYTPADGFIRYYRLPAVDSRPLLNTESIGWRIRHLLTKAVKKRLVSAAPVGLLCGGDLSSAIVAALAARQGSELHTFTVGRRDEQGKESADLEAARLTAGHIGAHHHELIFAKNDYYEALPQVIARLRSCDPALIGPAVFWFLVSKLAAEHVAVVLTGQGANELFAGHPYLKHFPLAKVNEECRRCLGALHHVDLQQADPLARAFNLQMRAPFLDKEMISLAMKIPADLKIKKGGNGPKISKWIFRQAFAQRGLVPETILWRARDHQSRQQSLAALGREVAAEKIDEEEWQRLRSDHPGVKMDCREAALYFKILQQGQP